jgi:hypothetical protein
MVNRIGQEVINGYLLFDWKSQQESFVNGLGACWSEERMRRVWEVKLVDRGVEKK